MWRKLPEGRFAGGPVRRSNHKRITEFQVPKQGRPKPKRHNRMLRVASEPAVPAYSTAARRSARGLLSKAAAGFPLRVAETAANDARGRNGLAMRALSRKE